MQNNNEYGKLSVSMGYDNINAKEGELHPLLAIVGGGSGQYKYEWITPASLGVMGTTRQPNLSFIANPCLGVNVASASVIVDDVITGERACASATVNFEELASKEYARLSLFPNVVASVGETVKVKISMYPPDSGGHKVDWIYPAEYLDLIPSNDRYEREFRYTRGASSDIAVDIIARVYNSTSILNFNTIERLRILADDRSNRRAARA
jgi:hypothetical protein